MKYSFKLPDRGDFTRCKQTIVTFRNPDIRNLDGAISENMNKQNKKYVYYNILKTNLEPHLS